MKPVPLANEQQATFKIGRQTWTLRITPLRIRTIDRAGVAEDWTSLIDPKERDVLVSTADGVGLALLATAKAVADAARVHRKRKGK